MDKKHKATLLLIGILIILGLCLSASYAFYLFNASQDNVNVMTTDCFKITYEDSNNINIINAIPMIEKDALKQTPYTFTISNICNSVMKYDVNIETLNTSTIDLDGVRYRLNKKYSNILGSIDNNSKVINSDALSSKTIYSDYLKGGETKSFDLRFWIDENATAEQGAGKYFESKVVINVEQYNIYSEAVLVNGWNFNQQLKKLAGGTGSSVDDADKVIKSILVSKDKPNDNVSYVDVADESSQMPVYAWFDTDTIYLYSEATKVFLNSEASSMFRHFDALQNLDLAVFDTTRTTNMAYMFEYCGLTEIDLSNFDTSNVTTAFSMFTGAKLTSINLSGFDFSNLTNMARLFYNALSLESLDFTGVDSPKLKKMDWAFDHMSKLKTFDLGDLDTSSVTSAERLFNADYVLEVVDFSNFSTVSKPSLGSLFTQCKALKTVYVGDEWNVDDLSNIPEAVLFDINFVLVGGGGTKYSVDHRTYEYARVDDPDNDKPGYFTYKKK